MTGLVKIASSTLAFVLAASFFFPSFIFGAVGTIGTGVLLAIVLASSYLIWFGWRLNHSRNHRSAHLMAVGCSLMLVSVNALVESAKISAVHATHEEMSLFETAVIEVFVLPVSNDVALVWASWLSADWLLCSVGLFLGLAAFFLATLPVQAPNFAAAKPAPTDSAVADSQAASASQYKRASIGTIVSYLASVLVILLLVQWTVLSHLAAFTDDGYFR